MSKLYLPSNYINNNYIYTYNGTYYTVRTNRNCYNNYNTTYCDTYYIYPNSDYLVTGPTSQSINNITQIISPSTFTNNYMYSQNFDRSLIISFILIIYLFLIPWKIISRMFGRWLKV